VVWGGCWDGVEEWFHCDYTGAAEGKGVWRFAGRYVVGSKVLLCISAGCISAFCKMYNGDALFIWPSLQPSKQFKCQIVCRLPNITRTSARTLLAELVTAKGTKPAYMNAVRLAARHSRFAARQPWKRRQPNDPGHRTLWKDAGRSQKSPNDGAGQPNL
jgi:hypothetical protein